MEDILKMRFSKIIYLLFFVSLISCDLPVTSLGQATDAKFDELVKEMAVGDVKDITVDDLYKHINQYLVLDARERREFEVSHIPTARWIGYDHINEDELKDIPKDRKIVLYCSVGYRSERMGEKLQERGYTDVHNLLGSLFLWSKKGYPMVDVENNETSKVHAYNRFWAKWLDEEHAVLD